MWNKWIEMQSNELVSSSTVRLHQKYFEGSEWMNRRTNLKLQNQPIEQSEFMLVIYLAIN